MVDFPRPPAGESIAELWGQPLIVEPTAEHTATVILLHGFSSTPRTLRDRWLPGLHKRLSDGFSFAGLEGVRFILPPAPVREISCYGTAQRPAIAAWHDYLTCDRAAAGEEELVDRKTLEETRLRLHEMLDVEIAAVGGDPLRVCLGGHSQGGCAALDAAVTYYRTIGGVLLSRGHLYSDTHAALEPDRADLRIRHFHGTNDSIIPACLAAKGWSALLQSGYRNLHVTLHPSAGTALACSQALKKLCSMRASFSHALCDMCARSCLLSTQS
jgi:predicted esterase